ncbi:MAG: hypothetical protein ACOCZ6_00950 [Nanoarchaeota archaeon]
MLSSFLRRLIFAREFFMINGKIELLGIKGVMLPKEILPVINNKKGYQKCKDAIIAHMHNFSGRHDAKQHNMMQIAKGIYESFGLGELKVNDNKAEIEGELEGIEYIAAGVLSGLISFNTGKNKDITPKKLKQEKNVTLY